jgi:hypothetical protein
MARAATREKKINTHWYINIFTSNDEKKQARKPNARQARRMKKCDRTDPWSNLKAK